MGVVTPGTYTGTCFYWIQVVEYVIYLSVICDEATTHMHTPDLRHIDLLGRYSVS